MRGERRGLGLGPGLPEVPTQNLVRVTVRIRVRARVTIGADPELGRSYGDLGRVDEWIPKEIVDKQAGRPDLIRWRTEEGWRAFAR